MPSDLEQRLGYRFTNQDLLAEACRHSSFVNEHPAGHLRDNERLEFLGDAVLNLVVSHLLMERHPGLKEGQLSRMRAGLVNETRLAEMARDIDLGPCLEMGRGETQTHGHEKKSILADAFEAIIASIYLDGGFPAAFDFVRSRFAEPVIRVQANVLNEDFKSKLQEFLQMRHHPTPLYEVVDEWGPDHDKTFTVRLSAESVVATGTGKSKKSAEQEAARTALLLLTQSA